MVLIGVRRWTVAVVFAAIAIAIARSGTVTSIRGHGD